MTTTVLIEATVPAVDDAPVGTVPPAGVDLSRDYFPQQRATRPPADAPSMLEVVRAIVTTDRPVEIPAAVVNTLRRTRGWLIEYGWVKHAYGDAMTGPGCLETAIEAVDGDVVEVARWLGFTDGQTPAMFNDHPNTRFGDVLERIDGAIGADR